MHAGGWCWSWSLGMTTAQSALWNGMSDVGFCPYYCLSYVFGCVVVCFGMDGGVWVVGVRRRPVDALVDLVGGLYISMDGTMNCNGVCFCAVLSWTKRITSVICL